MESRAERRRREQDEVNSGEGSGLHNVDHGDSGPGHQDNCDEDNE